MTYHGHTYDGEKCEHYLCKGPCVWPAPAPPPPRYRESCPHPEDMLTEATGPPCDPHPCRSCGRCGLTLDDRVSPIVG